MTTRLLTRVALLGTLLLALSPLGPTTGPAVASCVGPTLDVDQDEVVGSTLTVTGTGFVDGCEDTMSCGSGCSSRCTYDDPETPLTGVALTLRQGGRSWVLDEADADANGGITFSGTLPDGVRPGRAVLTADGGSRTLVRLAP